MKFGSIPIQQAEGKLFAHNIAGPDGRNAFRKGKRITAEDLLTLEQMDCRTVYAVELEPCDVDENSAARQVAEALMGGGLRIQGHSAGRVNLTAIQRGLLRVDEARLEQVNRCDGVTVATLRSYSLVEPGQNTATVKIIPYAIPAAALEQTLLAAQGATPLIQVKPLMPRRVSVIYTGSEGARERVIKSYRPALQKRVEALASQVEVECYVALGSENDAERLAAVLCGQMEQGIELFLVASETSTMDPDDIIPLAARGAGGQVACVGAPIEPGNLVMLAYFDSAALLNVPGCIRTPNPTIIDTIMAALLAGERLSRTEIIRLGHGGLVEGGRHGA